MHSLARPIFLFSLSMSLRSLSAQQQMPRAIPEKITTSQDTLLQKACTAMEAKYLSETEQDIIHIINIMRLDPPGFIEKVVKSYPELVNEPEMRNSTYYKSLLQDLAAAMPFSPDKPDTLVTGDQNHVMNR